jgi:hypothetical protein
MSEQWIKPDFQEITVSGECTAYAGAVAVRDAEDLSGQGLDPVPGGAVPAGCRVENSRGESTR